MNPTLRSEAEEFKEFRSSASSGTLECKPKRLAQDKAFIERVLTSASSNSLGVAIGYLLLAIGYSQQRPPKE